MGKDSDVDSAETAVSHIASTGKSAGYRVSEYSQKTQKKVDYYKYPSGKEVMTALNGNDEVFADSKYILIQNKNKQDIKRVHSVVITWRHQK